MTAKSEEKQLKTQKAPVSRNGLKTTRQWLLENGHEETVKHIKKFEEKWKERTKTTGKRTQRSWKQVMLGNATGKPVRMEIANGKVVEFPVLSDNESYLKEVFGTVNIEDVRKKAKRAAGTKKPKMTDEKKAERKAKREAAKDKIKSKLKKKKSKRAPKAAPESAPVEVKPEVAEAEVAPVEDAPQEDAPQEAAPVEATAPEVAEVKTEEAPVKRKRGRPRKIDKPKLSKEAVKAAKADAKPKPSAQESPAPAAKPKKEPKKDSGEKPSLIRTLDTTWRSESELVESVGQPLRLIKSQLALLENRNVVVGRKTKDGSMEWRRIV